MSLHLLPNGITLMPGVKPLLAETAAWYLLLLSGPTVQVILLAVNSRQLDAGWLSSVPHHAAVGHLNPITVAHIVLALEPYSVTVIVNIIVATLCRTMTRRQKFRHLLPGVFLFQCLIIGPQQEERNIEVFRKFAGLVL